MTHTSGGSLAASAARVAAVLVLPTLFALGCTRVEEPTAVAPDGSTALAPATPADGTSTVTSPATSTMTSTPSSTPASGPSSPTTDSGDPDDSIPPTEVAVDSTPPTSSSTSDSTVPVASTPPDAPGDGVDAGSSDGSTDSWPVTILAILGATVVVVAAAIWMIRVNRDGDRDDLPRPDGDAPPAVGSDAW